MENKYPQPPTEIDPNSESFSSDYNIALQMGRRAFIFTRSELPPAENREISPQEIPHQEVVEESEITRERSE